MTSEDRHVRELERVRKMLVSASELGGHGLEALERAISTDALDEQFMNRATAAQFLQAALRVIEVG